MTPELKAYLDYDPLAENNSYEELQRLRSLVNREELRAYRKQEKDKYFSPENEDLTASWKQNPILSPSGKYKLSLHAYNTKAGSWSYVQGKLYSVNSDEPLAVVNRNYSSFPHLFVENHTNGHDYLICGEDYQGQTVIELDTGKRVDYFPDEAYDGFGFCCSSFIEFDTDTQLLLVEGCYWACPYEYRFYDFSDPMSQFKWMETEQPIDEDIRRPTIDKLVRPPEAKYTITTYQSEMIANEDEEDEEEYKAGEVRSYKNYRIEDGKLILVREWVSEKEKNNRIEGAAKEKAYREFVDNYKATDPIWLRLQELIKKEPFKPDTYSSVGFTHKDWCPTWQGNEKRFCQRLYDSRGEAWTFDIEIAHLSGPIKLCQYKEGKVLEPLFFEHSVAGLEEALSYASEKLLG